jgi:hypothetical protein
MHQEPIYFQKVWSGFQVGNRPVEKGVKGERPVREYCCHLTDRSEVAYTGTVVVMSERNSEIKRHFGARFNKHC